MLRLMWHPPIDFHKNIPAVASQIQLNAETDVSAPVPSQKTHHGRNVLVLGHAHAPGHCPVSHPFPGHLTFLVSRTSAECSTSCTSACTHVFCLCPFDSCLQLMFVLCYVLSLPLSCYWLFLDCVLIILTSLNSCVMSSLRSISLVPSWSPVQSRV